MAFTTTEFLTSVKLRGAIPTNQNTFTVAGLLALGDEELRSYIAPRLLKSRGEYYLYNVDTPINDTGRYYIPTRAIGGQLSDAALIDGSSRQDLNWYSNDELTQTDSPPNGKPGIVIQSNTITLLPTSPGYSTLRLTIPIRPGKLVPTSSAAQVTGVDTATGTLTFASGTIPSSWTVSNTFDMIQGQAHFDYLAIDQTASAVTTTSMIFPSLSSRIAVGDWVSLAGESPVVQAPVELQPLLYQRVANVCLRAQGDKEAIKDGKDALKEMEEEVWNIFTPRISEEGKKIVMRSRILRRT